MEILAVVIIAVALLSLISLFSGEMPDNDHLEVGSSQRVWLGAVLVPLGLLLTAGFLFREALDKATILPFTVRWEAWSYFRPLAFLIRGRKAVGLRILHESRRLAWRWDFCAFRLAGGETASAIILWVIFIVGLMLVFRISMAQLLLAFKGLGAQIHQLVITSANTAPVQEEERRRPQRQAIPAKGNGHNPEPGQGELTGQILEPEPVEAISAEPVVNTMDDWKEALPEPKPVEAKAAPAWRLPEYDMLAKSSPAEINREEMLKKAKIIEDTLGSFNVVAVVREVNSGPTVTQFALEPAPGMKVSKITSLSNDLALALAAPSIRLEAPVPGQSRVGIEIPNAAISVVGLRDVMESAAFQRVKGKLRVALGRDVSGNLGCGPGENATLVDCRRHRLRQERLYQLHYCQSALPLHSPGAPFLDGGPEDGRAGSF